MEVTTDIKKSDLIRFNLAIVPKTRSTYMTILFIAALAFVFIVWDKGLPQSGTGWFAMTIGSIGGGIVGMLVGMVVSSFFILLTSSEKNGILGKHEFRISQEGLHEKTSVNEGVSKWAGIMEIQTAGGYLLYRVSGYLCHVIPYRSFPSVDARKEFENVSIQFWKNAPTSRSGGQQQSLHVPRADFLRPLNTTLS